MRKTIVTIFAAAFIGVFAVFVVMKTADAQKKADGVELKTEFKFPLKTALYRFEVNAGKEQKFAEWMNYLTDHRPAAVETLGREKMYFESVFTEKTGGKIYVFWLEFKGEGGKPVESSTLELDKKHGEYWNECIKKGSRTVFETEFYLTPEFLDKAIKEHQKTEKE